MLLAFYISLQPGLFRPLALVNWYQSFNDSEKMVVLPKPLLTTQMNHFMSSEIIV